MTSLTASVENITCPSSLLWSLSTVDCQKSAFYVCIIAIITHSIFWFQLILSSSVRQKAMQWLYAYLITDILLLFRFFFLFIIHTRSEECASSPRWTRFVCYFEAFTDNYLNVTEVYILLAFNICRFYQIVYNRNVYTSHVRSLICVHLAIYVLPIVYFIVQVYTGWAQLEVLSGESCSVSYTSVYAQICNLLLAFTLPISLNILVICASVRHVHLISQIRRTQHHLSARDKYHRSLVLQFLIFYTVWLLLWSPNMITNQLTSRTTDVSRIVGLLNYVEITLDPFIIAALDVRFFKVWKKIVIQIKHRCVNRVQPINTDAVIPLAHISRRVIL